MTALKNFLMWVKVYLVVGVAVCLTSFWFWLTLVLIVVTFLAGFIGLGPAKTVAVDVVVFFFAFVVKWFNDKTERVFSSIDGGDSDT